MLKNVEKETLEEWEKECKEKYDKLEIETVQKALTGEIGTNGMMVEALKDLEAEYQCEMMDYSDFWALGHNPKLIEVFENAEKNGMNVVICAQNYLNILGICNKVMDQRFFVNEGNKICDEYGNRLSSDLDHRVFEVIPGGKQ